MISRMEGELTAVTEGKAELSCQSICYQILVPACDVGALTALVGQTVLFHTLHYLESSGQGTAFIPRLVGFRTPEDRAFFELFTTVKGVGTRRCCALQLPFPLVAEAIAEKDLDVLVSLPEIGKRTAQTILAELDGKVSRFIELKPDAPPVAGAGPPSGQGQLVADAVAVLVQLGEPKLHARQLVDRALRTDPTIATPDTLVAAAFRLKDGL